ncbi:hypothetical protein [Tessaracoccus sp.]
MTISLRARNHTVQTPSSAPVVMAAGGNAHVILDHRGFSVAVMAGVDDDIQIGNS